MVRFMRNDRDSILHFTQFPGRQPAQRPLDDPLADMALVAPATIALAILVAPGPAVTAIRTRPARSYARSDPSADGGQDVTGLVLVRLDHGSEDAGELADQDGQHYYAGPGGRRPG
jgi:hypothetical protein